MKNTLTKSEVALELGISASTLLRYCSAGLLTKPKRHPVNGWRVWSTKDVLEARKRLSQRVTSHSSEFTP